MLCATNHYLNLCWQSSMTPYVIARQWVKGFKWNSGMYPSKYFVEFLLKILQTCICPWNNISLASGSCDVLNSLKSIQNTEGFVQFGLHSTANTLGAISISDQTSYHQISQNLASDCTRSDNKTFHLALKRTLDLGLLHKSLPSPWDMNVIPLKSITSTVSPE